ncbi:MAG TPA: hypothetical protein VNV85_01320 [Puia sp.]|nr:hypothetical protein [Puia sp.]
MKKLFLLLLVESYFSTAIIKAQPECSGVYLTANDYTVGKLRYACATRSTSKGSYYDLLARSHFFIIQQDYAWQRIDKQDVFAIKGCEGEIVRIFQGINFYLLNPGEDIPIYKAILNPVSKGNIIRVKYCFSKSPVSEILDLTIENLKSAFPDNAHFSDAIDAHFKDDSDLYVYNNMIKSFELNRVYNGCK